MTEAAANRLYLQMPAENYELKTRLLFNPELAGRLFIVPGLAAIIGFLAIITSLTAAKE